MASFLEARSRAGEWLVRMDDLDHPRNVRGSGAAILRELERLGLQWDHEVVYQSERATSYQAALERLSACGASFPCACTRREVGKRVYPGTCRNGVAPGRVARSVRMRVADTAVRFCDRIQGPIDQRLGADVGDFVIHRADGIVAYHLAMVVDDEWQHITDVVRGADLLDSTARQIHLQTALGYATPGYAHLPVATNQAGQKLSKQTHARPTAHVEPARVVRAAMTFLGHSSPAELEGAPLDAVWAWAHDAWSLERVPRRLRLVWDGEDFEGR